MSDRFAPPASIHDPDAPRLEILSTAARERIHASALSLLEDPGIQVMTAEARDVLIGAGCSLVGEDVVRIPRTLVEEAISQAPKTFIMYDRRGEEAMRLGEGRTHFGTGVTSLYYQDPRDRQVRDFTFDDIAQVSLLTDALAELDFIATPGVVRATADVPIQLVNHFEFLAMVENTTKPLMLLVADGPSLADIVEMASLVVGGADALLERPFISAYLNSVTPLQFNVETLDKLLVCADAGIPVTSQSAPNVGATSPVTVAGTTALACAETLAGLVIAQARRPGTPYLAGTMPMVMDMRTGQVVGGGSSSHLTYLAGVEMAKHWGLPQVGAGGSSDAKIPDEQAAESIASGILMDILEGVDMSFDAGGMEMGLTHSAVLMTMDDDVIRGMRGILRGVPVDDESLALEATREVGIGGHFLASPHTLAHFRELAEPGLHDWNTRRDWEAAGSTSLGDRARARTLELLETHRVEPIPEPTLAAMREVIERRRSKLPPPEED
jgi:trimethylamine--corrinoid protein Co-methyltransferase